MESSTPRRRFDDGPKGKSAWIENWYNQRLGYQMVCRTLKTSASIIEDYRIREFIKEKLYIAGIARIEIREGCQQGQDKCPRTKTGHPHWKRQHRHRRTARISEKLTGRSVLINITEIKAPGSQCAVGC